MATPTHTQTTVLGKTNTREPYDVRMRQSLIGQVNQLEGLSDLQRDYLVKRWLEQLAWVTNKAVVFQKRHYWARGVAIVCGALLIVIANVAFDNKNAPEVIQATQWMFNFVSLIAFLAFASENVFKLGEKWQHYRRLAEMLKSEGWKYFSLSDAYARFDDHVRAFQSFAKKVEDTLVNEVDEYISDVATEAPIN